MHYYTTLNPISFVGLDRFSADYQKTEKLEEAEIALVRSAVMHEMELPKSLLAVARAGAGVNNIPLEKCAEAGIAVFNTPGANANGVKELVLAGMLLSARDISGGIAWAKENASDPDIAKNAEKQKKAYAGTEIAGKKLGVIGLGAIGVRVANACVNLDMEVYGYDPYISVNAAWSLSRAVHHVNSIEDICRECDYITIHVPLMDSTKKMLSKECVEMMKETAVILNFARDLLVDEDAVIAALAAGKLRKYVTDFPNPTTAGKDGVIVIPHLGASTEESEDNCAVMAVEEVMEFLEKGNIAHSVNFPDCSMGDLTTAERIVVLHRNISGSIGRFTSVFGDAKINIANMTNKGKGEYAVTLLDLDDTAKEETLNTLANTEGVLKVRAIRGSV